MSVLIVGGAGYIGSQTAKAVAAAGLEPIVFDNLVYGHEWAVKWGPLVRGDLADRALLVDVMKRHRVDAVIHFAAYAYVGESVTNPRKYFGNNVVGTLNLLDAMLDAGVRDVVFSSTCATYGEPAAGADLGGPPAEPGQPVRRDQAGGREDAALVCAGVRPPLRGAPLLQRGRRRSRRRARRGSRSGDAPHPARDRRGAAVERGSCRSSAPTTRRPTAPRSATTSTSSIWRTRTCARSRSCAAQGAAAALRLNLGTGRGHSVREVVAAVRKVTGRDVRVREVGRRAGDPPALVADARQAATVLGWKPRYPELEIIVEHAARWRERREST